MRRRAFLTIGVLALGCSWREPSSPGFADPNDDPGTNGQTRTLWYWRTTDILFVVDNTSTMARAQAQLASEVGGLLERLVEHEIDYRVAVTTTDNGNPWCPAGVTTPEGGKFVASACTERLDDFVHAELDLDARDSACKDLCPRTELGLLPTATDVDPNLVPRPWIEAGNLPPGLSSSEAIACMLPQGIRGCGFGSPLESAYLALTRATSSQEPEYGFLRSWAPTAVVFVTNKVDCSYNKDWAAIFDEDGNHAFWSDPGAAFPTRAVCWNAGVECNGDPNSYDGCEPVDYDVDGDPTDDPNAAVLRPMSRYVDLLREIEYAHYDWGYYDDSLTIGLIAGYADDDGGLVYADSDDPEVQDRLGIGPGCLEPDGNAVPPPVRLRALNEEFAAVAPTSVCADSYVPLLDRLADQLIAQAPQRCLHMCPWDADTSTEIVDPQCSVDLDPPYPGERQRLLECERDADGSYVVDAAGEYAIPPGEPGCFAALVDRDGLTPTSSDDLGDACRDAGDYFEIRVATVEPQAAARLEVSCIESRFPELHCPELF